MTKGRVPQVVTEGNRLGQLLVQPQDFGDRSGDLRNLKRMRETRTIVVAGRGKEYLCLVDEPSERFGMNDPIAVAMKRRSNWVLFLGA
jgi:hypothetical protein